MTDQRVHIAVQKSGRLAEKSLDLLQSAGYRLTRSGSDLSYSVDNAPIDLWCVRDDDIPTFVGNGVADLGIVGRNVLAERQGSTGNGDPIEIMPLGFGRCALRIAAPVAFDYEAPFSLQGLRIATTYPVLLQRFFDQHTIVASIVTMRGAVEVAPRLGLAEAICDLVSSGATLEANGLKSLATVLESEAVLIQAPDARPACANVIESLIARFRGVVASQGAKYVMMNAPRAALERITAILPGAGGPTITPLAGRDDAVAVHAVCQESVFWETLEELKSAGASAILVLPIEKMM